MATAPLKINRRPGNIKVASDLKHSVHEPRFIAVGRNRFGHPRFVAFAIKGVQGGLHVIRPISARFVHHKEVLRYKEGSNPSHRPERPRPGQGCALHAVCPDAAGKRLGEIALIWN